MKRENQNEMKNGDRKKKTGKEKNEKRKPKRDE